MNLTAQLAKSNRNITDITRIYHGRENCCRCGCGGRYFDRGTPGFTRALNAIQKPDFKPLPKGADMRANYGRCVYGRCVCRGVEAGPNYLDIPYNPDTDKCYCLYFD